MTKNDTQITQGNILKLFLHYLFPSVGATLITAIYVLGDSVIIGKGVGSDGIAALNIILPFFNLFFATGFLFGTGGAVCFSMLHGQGNFTDDKKYFSFGAEAAILISIIYDIVIQIFFKNVVFFIGADKDIYPLVAEYGRIFVAFAPIFVLSTFLQCFVRNDGSPVCAMIGVISGGICNILFDYIFIYIFNMGMTGGVIATVMGSSLTCIILITHFFKKNNNLKFAKYRLTSHLITRVLRTGLPNFFIEFSNGIIISLFNIKIASMLGSTGITAYSIVSNSSLAVAAIANGISQGAQPLLAANYGAAKQDRIKKLLKYGRIISLICCMLFIAVFEMFPQIIIDIFIHSTPEINKIATPALRIYTISFLGMFLNLFHSTYFQSTGNPAFSIAITSLRGLFLSAALVFVLPIFFGVNGIWAVMPVTDTFVLILSAFFFMSRKNKNNV